MQADDWTPEHSEALRDHVMRGMSFARAAAEINARFGTSYTRNAAIGRGKRMGLVGSPQPTPAMPAPKRLKARERAVPRQPKPASGPSDPGTSISCNPAAGASSPGTQTGGAPAAVVPVQLRCVGISPRLVSFAELEPGDCRYPYGGDKDDEAIAFCGHPRRDGASYCTPHFHLTRVVVGTEAERAVGPITLRLVQAA